MLISHVDAPCEDLKVPMGGILFLFVTPNSSFLAICFTGFGFRCGYVNLPKKFKTQVLGLPDLERDEPESLINIAQLLYHKSDITSLLHLLKMSNGSFYLIHWTENSAVRKFLSQWEKKVHVFRATTYISPRHQ